MCQILNAEDTLSDLEARVNAAEAKLADLLGVRQAPRAYALAA